MVWVLPDKDGPRGPAGEKVVMVGRCAGWGGAQACTSIGTRACLAG